MNPNAPQSPLAFRTTPPPPKTVACATATKRLDIAVMEDMTARTLTLTAVSETVGVEAGVEVSRMFRNGYVLATLFLFCCVSINVYIHTVHIIVVAVRR